MEKVWISDSVKHHASSGVQWETEIKVCLGETMIVLRIFCFSQLSQSKPIYTASLVHNENRTRVIHGYIKRSSGCTYHPQTSDMVPRQDPDELLSAAYLHGNHTLLGALSAWHPPRCLSRKSKGGSVSPATAADKMGEWLSDAAVRVCGHLLSFLPSQRISERTWCRFLCANKSRIPSSIPCCILTCQIEDFVSSKHLQ